MVRASYAQEHASHFEHARHRLHAQGQLTTSVAAKVARFTSALNTRRVPSARANDVPYDIRASYAQEHASYIDHARHPLHADGQLTTSVMAEVVRLTSLSNARHVTGTRANDVSYDIRASYAQEHTSDVEHARHPLHANGQLTMSVMAEVVRLASFRALGASRAQEQMLCHTMARASCAQEQPAPCNVKPYNLAQGGNSRLATAYPRRAPAVQSGDTRVCNKSFQIGELRQAEAADSGGPTLEQGLSFTHT